MKKICLYGLLIFLCAASYYVVFIGMPYFKKYGNSITFYYNYFFPWLKKLKFDETAGVMAFTDYYKQNKQDLNSLEQGKLYWHLGDFDKAISLIEKHHEEHEKTKDSLHWLGMSYLRFAEEKNCLNMLTTEEHKHHKMPVMCTLPLNMTHPQKHHNKKAAAIFKELLDTYDSDNTQWKWLLNFCAMTIGEFPQEVPEKYRIPANGHFYQLFFGEEKEKMTKKYAHIKLTEKGRELHVDLLDSGKGVAVEDFDRDGYLDIVTGGSFSGLKLFRNRKGKTFEDISQQAGLSSIKGIHIFTAADYNNDGWIDLLVGRQMASQLGTYSLLENQKGTFLDVTESRGLRTDPSVEVAAWMNAWGDIDNDGDLDVFLCSIGTKSQKNPGVKTQGSRLFVNENNIFVDKTKEYGLEKFQNAWGIGVSFGDFDNDGYVDLLLNYASYTQYTYFLLKNIDGKTFKQYDTGLPMDNHAFMAAFVDINHDGLLDLYIPSQTSSKDFANEIFTIASPQPDEQRLGQPSILVQDKNGTFTYGNLFRNNMATGSMGTNFGDLNNDGLYDFYIGTGSPEGEHIAPNLMFISDISQQKVTGVMDNISMLQGMATIQKGHGIVFFDFDHDGDQDIYSSLGGMWPADSWPNQFFVNDSKGISTKWVKIRLRGRKNNYYGLGSKIKVVALDSQGDEIIRHYHMDNQTGFGSAPYLAHIGLTKDAVKIKEVAVTWLGDQEPKVYQVKMNSLAVLDENVNGDFVPN